MLRHRKFLPNSMNIIRPASKQPIPEHAQKVFSGKLFDVYQWQQEMYDGTTETFEKLKRPDTVVVFAVLPDGKILLTKQEQPGKTAFIGATGGRVDHGEDPLTAAKRELLEESGYEAERFTLWRAEHPTSKIDWVVYTFIAKGLTKVSEPHLDEGEKITLMPTTLDELIELAVHEQLAEKEVAHELQRAKYDTALMSALKLRFDPTTP